MMPRQYDAAAVEAIAEKIEKSGKPQAAQKYREAMRRAHLHEVSAASARSEAWAVFHLAMNGEEGGK